MAKEFIDILRGEPCNARKKFAPDGRLLQLMAFPRSVFSRGLEAEEIGGKKSAKCKGKRSGKDGSVEVTARRARTKLQDYIECNPDLDLFVTLTLSPDEVDRTDIKEITRKLKHYCDNRVRRRGLKYVLVPEFHADHEAYHFHGLFNSAACWLVDSGHKHKTSNAPIYNLADWKIGFTTAIKVYGDSRTQVARYVGKYIVKQLDGGRIAGRYYYHGGDLQEPRYEYFNLEYDTFDVPEFEAADGIKFKVSTFVD